MQGWSAARFFGKQRIYIALAELTGLSSGAILKSTCCPMFSATFPYLRHLISENGVNDCCPVLYRPGCSASIPGMGRHAERRKHYFLHAPQLMVIPGLAIMFIVLLSNLYGDRLRDRFDVKHKKGVS
ncbi:hypothetical protein PO124_29365 [Bacillus licheniformis]|nr:hypothetical protein [Bacillus licheniformis]